MRENEIRFQRVDGIVRCVLKALRRRSERDRPEGSRSVESLSHLVDGNNGKYLPDGRKALITIQQGNQHVVLNRNSKHNQIETTNSRLVLPRLRFDKDSENTRGQYIYI